MNSKVLIVTVAVIIVAIAGVTILLEEGKDDGKGSGGDVSMLMPGSQITYTIETKDRPTEETTLTIMGLEGKTYYVEFQRGIYSHIGALPSYDKIMANLPEGAKIDSLEVSVPGIGNAVGERITLERMGTTEYVVFLKDWGYILYSDGDSSPEYSYSETMTDSQIVMGEYLQVQPLTERFNSETGGFITVERISQSVDGGYLYGIGISEVDCILYVGTESMVPNGKSEGGAYTINGDASKAVLYCEGGEVTGIEIDGTVYLPEGSSTIAPDTGVPELKESVDVGDWYTLRATTTHGGVDSVTDTAYVYEGTEDGADVVSVHGGSTTVTETMPDGFLSLIVPTYVQSPKFIKTGSETIETLFGNIPCDIFEGTVTTLEGTTILKVWLCPDNGVAFRIQTNMGESLIELIGTSMFINVPGSSSGSEGSEYSDSLRTELRIGDYIEFSLDIPVMGIDAIVKYEIIRISESSLVVRYTEGSFSMTIDLSVDEFLETICPMFDSTEAELVGEQTIRTIAGDISCNIYKKVEGEDASMAYISKTSGIIYRVDVDSEGRSGTYLLKSTSLVGSS